MNENNQPGVTPLFSIMIPVYKPQYLKECIDSILAQTYRDFELILVNDGSPYDIDSIVSQYHDDRIEYHKREKGFGAIRLVDNWNDCLKYVKGEYVINMGDDDKLLPNCLSDYVKLIEKYPGLDIYHMRTVFIDDYSKEIGLQKEAPEFESVWSLMWNEWYGGRATMIGDFLFRVSTLRKEGGFFNLPLAWHSDKISSFIGAATYGIANTIKPGFCFRQCREHLSAGDPRYTDAKASLWHHEILVWYQNFFNTHQPKSKEDEEYKRKLLSLLDVRMNYEMLMDMKVDVNAHHYRWFHWLFNSRKYGLTLRNLLGLLKNGVFAK